MTTTTNIMQDVTQEERDAVEYMYAFIRDYAETAEQVGLTAEQVRIIISEMTN
jgi:peptide deformylase